MRATQSRNCGGARGLTTAVSELVPAAQVYAVERATIPHAPELSKMIAVSF